jgi:hypothetical protein
MGTSVFVWVVSFRHAWWPARTMMQPQGCGEQLLTIIMPLYFFPNDNQRYLQEVEIVLLQHAFNHDGHHS